MSARTGRLSFRVPASRLDELVAELWALGTTGAQVVADGEPSTLEAYFESRRLPDLKGLGSLWERCGATLLEASAVEDEDWLAAYRATCEPIEIGPFVIDAREPEAGGWEDAPQTLRIPARNAFGTGSHESTRLILEALAQTDVSGRSVLDVGTGSGILALAAMQRGARRVVAFDVDVGSVITARDNAELNRLAPQLLAATVDALVGSFDVVLVNVLPHRWLDRAAEVVARLRPGAELLVSGLLIVETARVVEPLRTLGLTLARRRRLGEWAALHFR